MNICHDGRFLAAPLGSRAFEEAAPPLWERRVERKPTWHPGALGLGRLFVYSMSFRFGADCTEMHG